MNSVTSTLSVEHEQTRQTIDELLNTLSQENLVLVQRFIEFLREQARQGQRVVMTSAREEDVDYVYPTVPVPLSKLEGLVDLMPPVGGDALADTEALYDKV